MTTLAMSRLQLVYDVREERLRDRLLIESVDLVQQVHGINAQLHDIDENL